MTQALSIVTNAGPINNGLIITEFNGFPSKATYGALVTKGLAFTGQMDLSNPFGTFWNDYTQVGALTITNGPKATVGGADYIKITADGSAINIPASWVNIGTTAISVVAADVNRIIAIKVSDTEVNYSVKVN